MACFGLFWLVLSRLSQFGSLLGVVLACFGLFWDSLDLSLSHFGFFLGRFGLLWVVTQFSIGLN